MAIKLKNTCDAHLSGVKLLVYGQAGSGKTCLIPTLPDPIILSAEGGLLSIQDAGLPYIEISCLEDLNEAYKWLIDSAESSQFQSVAIDSISEIAEVILNKEKKNSKDPRQAYGNMQEQMTDIIRSFRDLPKNVYFSAKLEQQKDEMGRILYSPSMPGNKTGLALPYFFDEVFALRVERDADNNVQRALMTNPDGLWSAKDRSGKLPAWVAPNLGEVIKIIGGKK